MNLNPSLSIRLILLCWIEICTQPLLADVWRSIDGKEINASFVKSESGSVTLETSGNRYVVPLDRLNPESRAYAEFLESSRTEWVAERMEMPIIQETDLLHLAEIAPEAVEGRTFLTEGTVAKVNRPSGLAKSGPGEATIVLKGGTESRVDFAEEIQGDRYKTVFEANGLLLMKAMSFGGSGNSDYKVEKTLVKTGDTIVLRTEVARGRILGAGLAPSGDVTAAQVKAAAARGGMGVDAFSQLEEMRQRITFLEMALREGNAGTSQSFSTVSGGNSNGLNGTMIQTFTQYEFTAAEKAAMKSELELLKGKLAAAAGG